MAPPASQGVRIGPFDGRRKQSRCTGCARSHLKCSGEQPCMNCTKKQLSCTYPTQASKALIVLHTGSHSAPYIHKPQHQTQSTHIYKVPSDGMTQLFYYFDVFAEQNNLTGRQNRTIADDVKQSPEMGHSNFLIDAIMSVGALQQMKLLPTGHPKISSCRYAGMLHYAKAVAGLREHLTAHQPRTQYIAVIWTTLFLGLVELMNETTGDGWLQHMVHGTAKGIEAIGPSLCSSANGKRLFMQARVFEVCRTILFNEPTFLTEPLWAKVSRDLWRGDDSSEWRPLDSLLDVMVMISSLRVRAANLVDAGIGETELSTVAESIASDGIELRRTLQSWKHAYVKEENYGEYTFAEDDSILLARIFYAAISVYLSGVYDYELHFWDKHDYEIPTLCSDTIQSCVRAIISLVEYALQNSKLSPLLYLFPLRIAGARAAWLQDGKDIRKGAWAPKEARRQISTALSIIGQRFAVAASIGSTLETIWGERIDKT